MVLMIVALAIVGFFFPPAWLALAGFGIYLIASHKSRRDTAIEDRVKKMVSAGKNYAVFADLYFESARSYAVSKGAKAPEPNAASARILVDGHTYFVVFTRATSGGTIFGVEDAEDVRDRVLDRSKMEEFLDKNMEKAFDEFGTSTTSNKAASARRGSDLRYNLKVSVEDAQKGIQKTIQYPISVTCPTCSGMGEVRAQQGAFTVERTCPTCNGTAQIEKEKSLSVNIPADVETGTRIKLAGEGDIGMRGGPMGDLYIFIEVTEHKPFGCDDPNTAPDTFLVGGLLFSGDPSSDKVSADIVNKVTGRVLALSPTELDIYRYLMEEADRLSQKSGIGQWALMSSGITPLEYEGEIKKSDKYPDNRAALDYLNNKVSPDLKTILGESKADDFRANIFTNIILSNAAGINELRKKHAVHYANNCTANGHFGFADKWDEVINSIS